MKSITKPMKNLPARLLPLLPLALASCVLVVDGGGKGGSSTKLSVGDGDGEVRAENANDSDAGTSTARASNATAHAMEKGVFPYPIHEKRLANGLLVLVVPMPSEGLVSYWSIVRTGSRDEVEKGVTGFAHFFEHMMFRGTEKYPGDVYDKIVNGMGADANAFTSNDITAYHLSITKDDLPTVVEIESDRFQNLAYDEPQFQTEAGAVYGEYRKNRASPFGVLEEALRNVAFDVHTYKHTTIGFEADIQAMPQHYDYSKTFFQRFYRPENVVILVAGDVDPAATTALVEAKYAGWKKGYQTPKVAAEPEQTSQRRLDVPFEGQTLPILQVAFKGERFLPSDRRAVAGSLIAELSFGEISPLYKKLVLDEQRCESFGAFFGISRDPELWSVYAMVKDPADVAAVEGEIWSAVDVLSRTPPTEKDLESARTRLKYSFLTGLTTPDGVCQSVAYEIALTGDLKWIDEYYATLGAVTAADVQAAAQHYLRPERSTVAICHPEDQAIPEPKAGAQPPVLLAVPSDPNIAFKIWFQIGSQDDPAGKEGLAGLTAAMISEGGTKKRSYDEILAELFPLAAGYGVSVDKEMTVVEGEAHRDLVDRFYPLFLDAVLAPGFRQEDFDRLRDQAVSSIENTLRYSSDEELGKAALYGKVFEGSRYAHIGTGTVTSLQALTLDDVKAFWESHYTQDNMVVALGGSFDEDLRTRLIADLARLPMGTPDRVPAPTPAPIEGRHALLVEKPGPTTAISFGYPIDLHRGSREYYALWIANSWLGEHRNSSSHLYQVIREARGMNYGDYSYIEAYPNGGRRTMPPSNVGRRAQMFEVWIRPVPEERALFALRAGLREVEKLATNGMTKEQFEFTKGFLKKYSLHFAETTEARLGYAVDDRFFGLKESHLATFRKMMDEITLDEVNAAVRKYIRADDLQIALVTANAEKLWDQLVSDAPTPMDYAGIEKPAEVLAEDREIERYPLRIPATAVEIVPVENMFQGPKP